MLTLEQEIDARQNLIDNSSAEAITLANSLHNHMDTYTVNVNGVKIRYRVPHDDSWFFGGLAFMTYPGALCVSTVLVNGEDAIILSNNAKEWCEAHGVLSAVLAHERGHLVNHHILHVLKQSEDQQTNNINVLDNVDFEMEADMMAVELGQGEQMLRALEIFLDECPMSRKEKDNARKRHKAIRQEIGQDFISVAKRTVRDLIRR